MNRHCNIHTNIEVMQDFPTNNKRIAKNTFLLYIRMLFVMLVSLYTSRVILEALGIEDYGLYNVIGGIVTFLGFINTTMSAATQRFLTFSLGKDDIAEVKMVFNTAVKIHIAIAVLLIIRGETIGLWFLYNKLVIPEDRIDAAIWVFQFSLVTAFFYTINIPYNALIISHERMSAFAYISIFSTIAQLCVALLIGNSPIDKLIFYALLIMLIQIVVNSFYKLYCHKYFLESRGRTTINKTILKEMINYSGWSLWGSSAVVLYTQGLNILLNMFFGTAINAARAVSIQVSASVNQLCSNFQMAVNPQITKLYASGNKQYMFDLLCSGTKYAFFLLFLIGFPIILETDNILDLWLVEVPNYSSIFIKLSIMVVFLDALSGPLMQAVASTGKIALYQTVIGGLLLMILPISYIILKFGGTPTTVYIVHICIASLSYVFRLLFVKNRLGLNLNTYTYKVLVRILSVVLISTPIPMALHELLKADLLNSIVIICISLIIIIISISLVGLDKSERIFVANKFKDLLYEKN